MKVALLFPMLNCNGSVRDQFYRVEAIPLLGTGKVDLMKARALAAERVGAASLS